MFLCQIKLLHDNNRFPVISVPDLMIPNPCVVDDGYRIGDITQKTTSSPLRVASVVQIKEVSKQA